MFRIDGSTLIVLAASHCRCMINIILYILSQLHPGDEYIINLKHVEDDYRSKFREKVYLVAPYNANMYHDEWSMEYKR